MKIRNNVKHLLAIAIIGVASLSTFGQNGGFVEGKPQETRTPVANVQKDGRQNLLMQLGLSRDQIRQVRMLNQGRRAVMESAQLRVREAARSLDDAIYNDELAESDIDAKVKELQLAQSEITKLRATNEIAVRKILTAEQLIRFRELRDRFEQMRQKNLDRRQERIPNKIDRENRQMPVEQPKRQFIKNQNRP